MVYFGTDNYFSFEQVYKFLICAKALLILTILPLLSKTLMSKGIPFNQLVFFCIFLKHKCVKLFENKENCVYLHPQTRPRSSTE